MQTQRLSDSVASELERRMLEGSLRAGQRLPPERELAAQLGVSRPSLREGLRKLASKGLVQTRHGGGTVVTDRLQAAFVDPWKDLLSQHPDLQQDLLELRHLLEGQAAELAAQRASELDLQRVGRAYERLQQAFAGDDIEACAQADVHYHQAIADATHNRLLSHLNASLHLLVHEAVQSNLAFLQSRPREWARLRHHHRDIWAHLQARRTRAAAQAARRHIRFVQESMLEREREQSRLARTRRLDGAD